MEMSEFNSVCVEHGLIFDEEFFKRENKEACRFKLAHPLFAEPMVIALYCDYLDDDNSEIRVFAPKSAVICHKNFERCQMYMSPNYVTADELAETIEGVKKLCDEELELQKGNELTTKQLADYLLYTLGNNAKIKLNCSIRELTQSPIGKMAELISV